ncbi:MFS transporter [Pseudomonas aeruginosa]|uniref:MFS transporter n=1 Tax=Pseudomonas aeruginosa TaxID=287 RepID=UPI000EB50F0F|nr:MFS transporter [Pseudomonas aeruginosa]HBO3144303.1 MFS transporter [Pseudomonas aeruginosa]HCL4165102.1 MFS transporter [Pseudomonas aeruginosa]
MESTARTKTTKRGDQAVPTSKLETFGSHRCSKTTPAQIFAIVCAGIVMANLDLFSVNVALPRIADEFHGATLEDLSWILNGYAIGYAALLVFFGRLAEGYRRDRSFVLGIGMFTLASAACATASGVWELVAFRIMAAVGAALMTPASLGVLLASFPPERRGAAVRNWAGIGGFAAALGPLVGGMLVSIDWRWIFLVNALIGAIAVAIAWIKLPPIPGHEIRRPSVLAALLVTGGIGALVFIIVKANAWGWHSQRIGISAVAAITALALFVWHSLKSSNPLVDPSLFRIRPFTGAVLAVFPYSISFGAMLFSIAVWGQSAWGWSALQAGLAMFIGPLLVPITSLIFLGKLIDRIGPAYTISSGMLMVVMGFCLWASCIGLEANTALVVIGMAINGVGVGLTFPTLMGVSTQALPPSSFATGSGLFNMIRQTAMAIGVAIFVAIISSPESAQARLEAFRLGWWVMAAITFLSLVPTLLLLRSSNQQKVGP